MARKGEEDEGWGEGAHCGLSGRLLSQGEVVRTTGGEWEGVANLRSNVSISLKNEKKAMSVLFRNKRKVKM